MSDPGTIKAASSIASAPAKGIIDALLGPTLERIRGWAKEKDVARQTTERNLQSVFSKYLARSLDYFSHIQSITFPQKNIPLSIIYEPLTLNLQATSAKKSQPFSENRDIIETKNNITIVDGAGMGKSTYAKYIAVRIFADTTQVPILLNLRLYDPDIPLAEALRREVSELDNNFSSDLFNRLVVLGKFFFILDGFDEVQPQQQSKVRAKIEEFATKCAPSRILLTARPQDNLPVISGTEIYTIRPLAREQAVSLVHRYDQYSGLDIGARLVGQFSAVPQRFLEVPLLVALLYRTFGFNNSVATRVSAFYGETFEALYKGHDLTKQGGFIRAKRSGLDLLEFRRMLRAFSFICFVKDKTSFQADDEGLNLIEESSRMCSLPLASPKTFWDDLLEAVPLLVRDGGETKFIHKTIMEYFAAEFVSFSKNSEPLTSALLKRNQNGASNQILEFIADISPSLARSAIYKPLAEKIVKKFDGKRVTMESMLSNLFDISVEVSDAIADTERHIFIRRRSHIRTRVVIMSEMDDKAAVTLMVSPGEAIKNMPNCAWLSVTKRTAAKRSARKRGADLRKIFPENRKMSKVSHDELRAMLKNPALAERLEMLAMHSLDTGLRVSIGRIVDIDACKQLIEIVHNEAAANSEFEALLK